MKEWTDEEIGKVCRQGCSLEFDRVPFRALVAWFERHIMEDDAGKLNPEEISVDEVRAAFRAWWEQHKGVKE